MKVLITDIFLRKTFDLFNIIKSQYKEYTPLLLHSSTRPYSRLKAYLIYSTKIYGLRKSSYEVFEKDLVYILNRFKDSKIIYIPIEEDTTQLFYEFISKNSFPNLHYNLPEKRSFETARDKKKIAEFCFKHNIPVPEEFTKESLNQLKKKFRPLIVKPRKGTGAAGIHIIEKTKQLDILEKIDYDQYFVQEKIGDTNRVQGAFFLFYKGECLSYYCHRRIRTFPPSGGVTVFSEFDTNEKIKNIGILLLEKLSWSGFAMVEFLYDNFTETFKVIEINPRLWGSFILSEFSGTVFLKNYIHTSLGKPPIKNAAIKRNVYIRWFFPFDLVNYILSFGRIKDFWKFNKKNTCYINFTYSNLFRSLVAMPFLYSVYIKKLFEKIFKI